MAWGRLIKLYPRDMSATKWFNDRTVLNGLPSVGLSSICRASSATHFDFTTAVLVCQVKPSHTGVIMPQFLAGAGHCWAYSSPQNQTAELPFCSLKRTDSHQFH